MQILRFAGGKDHRSELVIMAAMASEIPGGRPLIKKILGVTHKVGTIIRMLLGAHGRRNLRSICSGSSSEGV